MADPVIPWVGGKRRQAPTIAAHLPTLTNHSYFVFAGGLSLFFHLCTIGKLDPAKATVADTNTDLCNLYQHVALHPKALISELIYLQQYAAEERYFLHIRNLFNGSSLSPLERAAAMMYLSRLCFNALWRCNQKGKFNVGYRKKPRDIVQAKLIEEASVFLSQCYILNQGFRTTIPKAVAGDLVYCDPPYWPLTPTSSFNSYQPGGFRVHDQHELARLVRLASGRGCYTVLHNSSAPEVLDIYQGFVIRAIMAPRYLNSNVSKRGSIAEYIIFNYEVD